MQNWNQWQVPGSTGNFTGAMSQSSSGSAVDSSATIQNYMQFYNQPPPNGCTADQWTVAQQWQQWQQQYHQWQAQYGSKYEDSLKQHISGGNFNGPISTMQPFQPPPLPKDDINSKPPLPPNNNNTNNYHTKSNLSLQNRNSNNPPPLPSEKPPPLPDNPPPIDDNKINNNLKRSANININTDSAKKLKNNEEDEDLTEAEKKFDADFKTWEEAFNKWKIQNAHHPDKAQYKLYEAQWTSRREKLIERREQMRRKREAQKAKTDLEQNQKNSSGGDKLLNILSNTENQGLINNLLGIGKSFGLSGSDDSGLNPVQPPMTNVNMLSDSSKQIMRNTESVVEISQQPWNAQPFISNFNSNNQPLPEFSHPVMMNPLNYNSLNTNTEDSHFLGEGSSNSIANIQKYYPNDNINNKNNQSYQKREDYHLPFQNKMFSNDGNLNSTDRNFDYDRMHNYQKFNNQFDFNNQNRFNQSNVNTDNLQRNMSSQEMKSGGVDSGISGPPHFDTFNSDEKTPDRNFNSQRFGNDNFSNNNLRQNMGNEIGININRDISKSNLNSMPNVNEQFGMNKPPPQMSFHSDRFNDNNLVSLNNRFSMDNRMNLDMNRFDSKDNNFIQPRRNCGKNYSFEIEADVAPELKKLMEKRRAAGDVFKPSNNYLGVDVKNSISSGSLSENFRKITGESPLFKDHSDNSRVSNFNSNNNSSSFNNVTQDFQNLNRINEFNMPPNFSKFNNRSDNFSAKDNDKSRGNFDNCDLKNPSNFKSVDNNRFSKNMSNLEISPWENTQPTMDNYNSMFKSKQSFNINDNKNSSMMCTQNNPVKEKTNSQLDTLPFMGENDPKPQDLNMELPNFGPIKKSDHQMSNTQKFNNPVDYLNKMPFNYQDYNADNYRNQASTSEQSTSSIFNLMNNQDTNIPSLLPPPRSGNDNNFSDQLNLNESKSSGFNKKFINDSANFDNRLNFKRPQMLGGDNGSRDMNLQGFNNRLIGPSNDKFANENSRDNIPSLLSVKIEPPKILSNQQQMKQESMNPDWNLNSKLSFRDNFNQNNSNDVPNPLTRLNSNNDFNLNKSTKSEDYRSNPHFSSGQINDRSITNNSDERIMSNRSYGFNPMNQPIIPDDMSSSKEYALSNYSTKNFHHANMGESAHCEFSIEKKFNYNHGGVISKDEHFVPFRVIDYGHIRRPCDIEYVTPIQSFDYSHGCTKHSAPEHEIYPKMDFKHWVDNEQNLKEYNDNLEVLEKEQKILREKAQTAENFNKSIGAITKFDHNSKWRSSITYHDNFDRCLLAEDWGRSRSYERDKKRIREFNCENTYSRLWEREKEKFQNLQEGKFEVDRECENEKLDISDCESSRERNIAHSRMWEREQEKYKNKNQDKEQVQREFEIELKSDIEEKGNKEKDVTHSRLWDKDNKNEKIETEQGFEDENEWESDREKDSNKDKVKINEKKSISEQLKDLRNAKEKEEKDKKNKNEETKCGSPTEIEMVLTTDQKNIFESIQHDDIFDKTLLSSNKVDMEKMQNITKLEDLLFHPNRQTRPPKIVIILRGPPGSGKSYVAKLIKDKELEQGGSAPRILSLDDYFLIEKEVESIDDNGRKVMNKEMVYEYEEGMEQSYLNSLVKAFKKNITDGYFNFIIVDCINEKISDYEEMWNFAKSRSFRVYACEMDMNDIQTCLERNIHNRTEEEINKIVDYFEPTPNCHQKLDYSCLFIEQTAAKKSSEYILKSKSLNLTDITEDSQDSSIPMGTSKWEKMETEDKLDRLDGLAKRKDNKPQTMEDFLQVPDYYDMEDTSGKKRVRWADLEERKEQEKIRAMGFVVGHTNWNRMMDPTKGSSALTRTKYI